MTTDNPLTEARGAFKTGPTDMRLSAREAVNDATHTARTNRKAFRFANGRKVPTVTVYFRDGVVDVSEDEDADAGNEVVDAAINEVVDRFDLVPAEYDFPQNAVVFVRADDVDR